jgi:hypothetical protein
LKFLLRRATSLAEHLQIAAVPRIDQGAMRANLDQQLRLHLLTAAGWPEAVTRPGTCARRERR